MAESSKKTNTAFRREVVNACIDALTAIGFQRSRRDVVFYDLGEGFLVWVGLNVGLHRMHLQINPFVGVHCVPLERLCARLSEQRYDRSIATVAIHLGEICPEESIFSFAECTDIEAEAARLANLYYHAGLPYVRSIASYEALLPQLMRQVARLGGYPQRAACCLFLMGRTDDAEKFVENQQKEYMKHSESIRLSFDNFAKRLREVIYQNRTKKTT